MKGKIQGRVCTGCGRPSGPRLQYAQGIPHELRRHVKKLDRRLYKTRRDLVNSPLDMSTALTVARAGGAGLRNPDTHTCPRCAGMPRAFAHFPHINQGKCLLCNGRLTVSAAQARAFIAAQHRGMLMPEDATAGVPEESGDVKLGEKSVQIPRLSRARIQAWRQPDGAVRFVLLSASDVGTLASGFRLVQGRVVPEGVCNGHLTALGRVSGFTKVLQDAHDRAARAKAKPNPIKPARRQQPLEEMVGTTHFGQRLWERLKGVSERKQKRALAVYTTLKLQRARTAGLNGRYAVQFGGESREAGDYLVVQIDHGAVTGFISVLINQLVIHPHTSIVSAKQLGIAYENPRRTSRRIRIPTSR